MKILKLIGAFLLGLIKGKDKTALELPELPLADKQIWLEDLEHAIQIVNNIKDAAESSTAVLITTLIPGSIDDVIRERIVSTTPQLIAGLVFGKHLLEDSNDASVQLGKLLERVRFSNDPDKNAFYHNMAARLLMILSDGKVTWSEAVMAVEYYFKNIFLKA